MSDEHDLPSSASSLWSVTREKKVIAEIQLCRKYSVKLVSVAFQEWRAFLNHWALRFLRTPSWFPSDHLLTHQLSPTLKFFSDVDSFNYTPSCCHNTDGADYRTLQTNRWVFHAGFKCTCVPVLGRIRRVTVTPDCLPGLPGSPSWSHPPPSSWVFWTRKAGDLRVLKHQSLSCFQLPSHSPVSALGQSSPSQSSLWMTVGPWLLQSAAFGDRETW